MSIEELNGVDSDTDNEPIVLTGAKRKRKVNHFDLSNELFLATMKNKKILVNCNQENKKYRVDVTTLSREDGEPLKEADLRDGSQLLMDYKKKSWAVTVIAETSESISNEPKKKKKSSGVDNSITAAKKTFDEVPEAQNYIEVPSCSSTPPPSTVQPSNGDLLNVMKEMLDILKSMKEVRRSPTDDDQSFMYEGVNLLHIPAKGPNAYGRSLLDVLFSKEEQGHSVVIQSIKSSKPPLSPRRVQLLFDCVNKRYKQHDHRQLMATLSQKCRDAGRRADAESPEIVSD